MYIQVKKHEKNSCRENLGQLFGVKLNEIATINGCRTRRFVFRRCLGTIPNAQANE